VFQKLYTPIFTHNSKSSFLSSGEICNKFIYEYGSLDQIQAGDIKMVYPDISWCKSYTSKHIIAVTVKELVISWFFGFRSFFKMFLTGRMSHIRVSVMIWSVQNTTYSFNGLYFLKSFNIVAEHDPTPADASLSHSFHSMPNTLIKYLIGLQMTRLSMLVTIQTGGLRTCYEQIERSEYDLFFQWTLFS
jgi:hypothetical protein